MTSNKCKPCDIAVTGIITHIDGLIEKMDALRDMEMFKQDEIELTALLIRNKNFSIR